MSEREGLYCEKHVKWCADGVCEDCAPAGSFAFWRSGPSKPMAAGDLQRQMNALWAKLSERTTDRDLTAEQAAWDNERVAQMNALLVAQAIARGECNHAVGYCKDTAHKYELPVE